VIKNRSVLADLVYDKQQYTKTSTRKSDVIEDSRRKENDKKDLLRSLVIINPVLKKQIDSETLQKQKNVQ
jgi:hypothetical protein